MRFAAVTYTVLVGTMMLINVLGHARGASFLARSYVAEAERMWQEPAGMLASIQVAPQ